MFFIFDCIPDQYETEEMCDRVFSKDPFLILYCPDKHKTQEMCEKIISGDLFSLRCVPDYNKSEQMCEEAVDDCLAALKFVPNWFATSKKIKKLFTALHADENILYFDEDSSNVVFICYEIVTLNIDLNYINFDDTNYDENDLDTIILIRLLAWHMKCEKHK